MARRRVADNRRSCCSSVLADIYFPESIDDVYITSRYARNLFEGHGRSSTWVTCGGILKLHVGKLLAAAGWCELSMPMAMKILVSCRGSSPCSRLLRPWRRILDKAWQVRCRCYSASSSFFAGWSVHGLETVLARCC